MSGTASVDVHNRYSLSQEELEGWHKNGFVGPYTAWTPEEVAQMRPIIMRHMERPSKAYGFHCIRDRHLDSVTVYRACTHPAIIERCASILGPNLVFWRTNFFHKPPGAPAIAWHRGTNFPGPRGIPAIDPQVNVTCWLALTDATRENGCVQLVAGSHKKNYTARTASNATGVFGRGKVVQDLDTENAVRMEVKAGQFFLFNEMTVHGSDPNVSQSNRTGIAGRITSNDTRVYPNQHVDGQGMHLKNWHAILVHGVDNRRHNKLGPPPTTDDYSFGSWDQLKGQLRYRWQHHVYGLTFNRG